MQIAMTEAIKMNLSIEEADAVFGRPMGIPKTGVFALYDLIGIDLMSDVLKSFKKELPENDDFQKVAKNIPIINKLIENANTWDMYGLCICYLEFFNNLLLKECEEQVQYLCNFKELLKKNVLNTPDTRANTTKIVEILKVIEKEYSTNEFQLSILKLR